MPSVLNYKVVLLAAIMVHVLFTPSWSGEKEMTVVARVNGVAITYSELLVEVNRRLPLISVHGKIRPEKMDRLVKETLEGVIINELKFQAAKKKKLKVSEDHIDQWIEKIKKKISSERDFEKALKNSGMTIRDLEEMKEKELMVERIEELEVTEKISFTDQHLEQYYNANRSKFVQPESLHLKHILIKVDPSSPPQGWEERKKQAQALLDKINKGESFTALAREYSEDTSSRERAGDLGFIHRGRLQFEIERVAFSLSEGEVGGPIQTIYGFHLIKLVEKRPERQLTFSEIDRELLRKELTESETERRREAWIKKLKERAQIELIGDISIRPPSPTSP